MKCKGLISFVFGAGIGSVCTYYFVNRFYERQIDVEVHAVRDYYENKYSDKIKADNIDQGTNNDEEEEIDKKINTHQLKRPAISRDIVDYTKYAVDSDKESNKDSEAPKPKEFPKPYMISEDEYSDTHPEYRKRSVIYIPETGDSPDEIVDTSTYDEIDNWRDLVGEDNVAEMMSKSMTGMYIRNEADGIDFDITLYEE